MEERRRKPREQYIDFEHLTKEDVKRIMARLAVELGVIEEQIERLQERMEEIKNELG
jgi:archaellum component FlaC